MLRAQMQSVKWGMIGAGSVTESKSGPAFQRASRSALVAVMRRTPGMAADYAQRHGIARYYENALDLVQDPAVDAIYVATPPGSHKELALLACRLGKPAYIEKPMARNYAECQEMNAAFQAQGLPLFVAYYRRKLPRFLAVKEMLDNARLGVINKVTYSYSRTPLKVNAELPWRLRAEHSGGGLFLDIGSHVLDLIDYLFGPVVIDTAVAINRSRLYDVEDGVTIHFKTNVGVAGEGRWDFLGLAKEDSLIVEGTQGRLQLSIFGDEPLRLTWKNGDEQLLEYPHPTPVQLPLIQSIVDELCGDGASPSTGKTAARTSFLIDEVLNAYYGRRSDAFWQRTASWPGLHERGWPIT